jgi:predicted ATPase
MQYKTLFQFNSIESVIELQAANNTNQAKQLVSSYVISKLLALRLVKLVFVNDNKALLIVGNYGTGKSHLMAVISSIAENADLLNDLNNTKVKKAAKVIAGQFKVLRIEIGATTMSLRDILFSELERFLAKFDLNFQFPAASSITNNKAAFEDMMLVFERQFPGQGLLVVVDELLEYLRSRSDQALIFDLNFLREVGEVCKNSRFRFIAGVQEAIFDNPRFEFVANALRRVKDRFEQLLITRQDIKYVVSQRLLKKSASQEQKIRDYLSKFASFYPNINERMTEFIDLFPVHPDYIDIFAAITVIEKREILKTIEYSVNSLVKQKLPTDHLGLITYDSYWQILLQNPCFRSLPEIREVIEASQVLENRLKKAFTRPIYQDMALRIIYALSVHRLTTIDIHTPVGVTAQELRDSLCLYHPSIENLGGNPADDLLSLVELVLQEILKTVNHQFLSYNQLNGQYYIDLKKNIDIDAIIQQRAETLEDSQLERNFYTALRQLMETVEDDNYELEWRSHKVTRLGSFAEADWGFVLCFGRKKLYFKLTVFEEKFEKLLALYSAANELMLISPDLYQFKSQQYLTELLQYLQTHKADFEVLYEGQNQKLSNWMPVDNFRDLVDIVADSYLDSYFSDLAPKYPYFSTLVSLENIAAITQETLRCLNIKTRSKLAIGILAALKLLDDKQQLAPYNSIYAEIILELVYQKPPGKVITQGELYSVITVTPYCLEPELVIILIAALVYVGELSLVLPKQSYDATQFEYIAARPIKELLTFKHIEKHKYFNLLALKALCELLELASGLEIAITEYDQTAVETLQTRINKLLNQIVTVEHSINSDLYFWGKPVLSSAEKSYYQETLSASKEFLESLSNYTNPVKFKNLKYTASFITAQWSGLKILKNINQLISILNELSTSVTYLSVAATNLPQQHEWIIEMQQLRNYLCQKMSDVSQRNATGFSYHSQQQLKALKNKYIKAYMLLHQQARLNPETEQIKQDLLNDKRLKKLKQLSSIPILPHQQLQEFEQNLQQFQSCNALTAKDLTATTICPHCQYKAEQTISVEYTLIELKYKLNNLYQQWTKILLQEIEKSHSYVDLEDFLISRTLPEEINREFIKALLNSLSKLRQININYDKLYQFMKRDGLPITAEEMEKRVHDYIKRQIGGEDVDEVRIVL